MGLTWGDGEIGRWVFVAEYALSVGLVRGVWDRSCMGGLHLVHPHDLILIADIHSNSDVSFSSQSASSQPCMYLSPIRPVIHSSSESTTPLHPQPKPTQPLLLPPPIHHPPPVSTHLPRHHHLRNRQHLLLHRLFRELEPGLDAS